MLAIILQITLINNIFCSFDTFIKKFRFWNWPWVSSIYRIHFMFLALSNLDPAKSIWWMYPDMTNTFISKNLKISQKAKLLLYVKLNKENILLQSHNILIFHSHSDIPSNCAYFLCVVCACSLQYIKGNSS